MNGLNQSGQSLMIALMVFLVLMISIPTIVFMNQSGSRHGVALLRTQRAMSVAQEGVAYAIHALSVDSDTWKSASVDAVFPPEFKTNGVPTIFTGSSGGIFTVNCSTGMDRGTLLQDYQLAIYIYAASANQPNAQDSRTLRVVVSRKTMGVSLPNQIQASVAFQFTNNFSPTSGIEVHWGPMALFDNSPIQVLSWVLDGPIDTQRYPRKFSNGPIKGASSPSLVRSGDDGSGFPDSDHIEYWANTSLGFPNVISTMTYVTRAKGSSIPAPAPTSCSGTGSCARWVLQPGETGVTDNGFFSGVTSAGTAVFDSGFGAGLPSNSVIVVDGNVELDNVNLDFKDGALIVLGNLTLGTPGTGDLSMKMRVPPTAALEYPYLTPGNPYPCSTSPTNCTTAVAGAPKGVHFRGFLYVRGNLQVTSPGWVIDGAMRVDGTTPPLITIPLAVRQLTVYYDDKINHAIQALPMELLIDSQTVVTQ